MSTSQTTPTPLTPEQVNAAQSAQWRQIVRQELYDLRVASPAYLTEDLDPTSQTVTVQIAILEKVRTLKGPNWTQIPPVFKVPIVLPRGGGFGITLPLKSGDEGMLVFCDACFDWWWQHGGLQKQIEIRRHDVTDCGFYPGMWSQPKVWSNYSTNSMQIRSYDGSVVIDVALAGVTVTAPKLTVNTTGDIDLTAQGNINISGQQVNVVAGTQVQIASDSDDTEIDGKVFLTHMHSGVESGGSDTGPVV